MADQDEDNPRLNQDAEVDLSDETQDFRFLNLFSKNDHASLPRRGEKDFEPDGTNKQDRILDDSRQAMENALLGERKLNNKQVIIGTWRPDIAKAEVHVQRGIFFKSMGTADKEGVWLLPEEVIYLVERGSMECRWDNGVPMSVQAVYAACLAEAGGLERYQVYSNLKRHGFAVYRPQDVAPIFGGTKGTVSSGGSYENPQALASKEHGSSSSSSSHQGKSPRLLEMSSQAKRPWHIGLFAKLFGSVFGGLSSQHAAAAVFGPLLHKGCYRSYEQIYPRLEITPISYTIESATDSAFEVDYFVYKPKPNFKKSSPGPPDFRISVVSTIDTKPPSLSQLLTLFESIPRMDELPGKNRNVMQRLKEGERYVVIAVVDSGVISYMRFSDVSFLKNRLQIGNKQGNKGRRGPRQQKAQTPK